MREKQYKVVGGEGLGGVRKGKTIIKIYCMKLIA